MSDIQDMVGYTDGGLLEVEEQVRIVREFKKHRETELYQTILKNVRRLYNDDDQGEPGFKYGVFELFIDLTVADHSAHMRELVELDIQGKLT